MSDVEATHQTIYQHVYRAVGAMLPEHVVTGSLWRATEDAARQIEGETFERAAQRLDAMGGNEIYRRAYRKAARLIRSMKDFKNSPQILNDTNEQIGNSSSIPSR